jgi:hypothetical protein
LSVWIGGYFSDWIVLMAMEEKVGAFGEQPKALIAVSEVPERMMHQRKPEASWPWDGEEVHLAGSEPELASIVIVSAEPGGVKPDNVKVEGQVETIDSNNFPLTVVITHGRFSIWGWTDDPPPSEDLPGWSGDHNKMGWA